MIKSLSNFKKHIASRNSSGEESADRRVACLQQDGDQWLVMIALLQGDELTVETTEETRTPASILQRNEIDEVICVLTSGAVICRICELPDGTEAELEAAITLQAEALLEQDIHAHRIAMAILPPSEDSTSRQGLIVAWPEGKNSSSQHIPDLEVDCRYVSDAVAITALAGRTNLSYPILCLSRLSGGIALCMQTKNGLAIRATREHVHEQQVDGTQWTETVVRAIGETTLHEGGNLDSAEEQIQWVRECMAAGEVDGLLINQSQRQKLSESIPGTSAEAAWWQRWGTCLGALLAYIGPLTTATELFNTQPVEERSRVREIGEVLGNRRNATKVLIACIILLAFGPMLFAGLRLGVLSVRYNDIDDQLAASQPLNDTMSMYRALKNETWPMSKLTADIVRHAPDGVEIDSFRLIHNKDFQIKGVAVGRGGDAAADKLIEEFSRNLKQTRIFEALNIKKDKEGSGGTFTFEISGEVANPYTLVKTDPGGPHDWTGDNTLRHRKYGMPPSDMDESSTTVVATTPVQPEAPVTTATTNANEDEEITARVDRPRNTTASASSDGAASRVGGGETGVRATGTVPPELTEEQLQGMSHDELQQVLREVMAARRGARNDPELMQRLRADQDLIFKYLQEKRNSSGS